MKLFAHITLLCLLGMTVALQAQVSTKIKWACIGDKITVDGYPARLQTRVIMDTVLNEGFSGGTVLKSGDSTYWTSGMLAKIFSFNPDIVSIDLGANDSKPVNWADSAHFVRDYEALIDTLSSMPSHPKIFLVYPTPVFKSEAAPQSSNLLRGSVIQNSIVPLIRQVALARAADTVDLNTPFLNRQTLFTDSINPTTAVTDSLAAHIFSGLLAQSTRVVCIGNSITQYVAATAGNANYPGGGVASDAYPIKFNMLMGRNYVMWNGGIVGDFMQDTILNTTYHPYFNETSHLDSIYIRQPSIVTIMLGTNDARPLYWNTKRYIASYEAFIDTLRSHIHPAPQIFLIQPLQSWMVGNPPAWPYTGPVNGANSPSNGIDGIILADSVYPAVAQVASAKGATTIDLLTPFSTEQNILVPAADGVHPNKAGDDTIAHIVYRTVMANSVAIHPQQSVSPNHSNGSIGLQYFESSSQNPLRNSPAGAQIYSLDGKAVSGSNQPLGAGIYVVKPESNASGKTPPQTQASKPVGN